MRDRFNAELKTAMKAGDRRRVDTIRMINAALKDKDIEARGQGKTVSDDDILSLLYWGGLLSSAFRFLHRSSADVDRRVRASLRGRHWALP